MKSGKRVYFGLLVVGLFMFAGSAGAAQPRVSQPLAGGLQWAFPLIGPNEEFGKVVSDREGGTLSMVDFTGSVDLGGGPILAPGGPTARALVLARHDAQGRVRVVRVFSNLDGMQFTVDAQRNIVLIVSALDPSAGSSLLGVGPYLMKLDATGRLLWLRSISYLYASNDSGLVTDRDGNIGVAGMGLVGSSPRLAFTKYSAEGIKLWSFLDTQSAQSEGRTAVMDSEGNVFVGGEASSGVSPWEPLVVMLSPQGQERWRRQLTGALGFTTGVATHGNRVVLVGFFAQTFTFAGQPHASVGNNGLDADAFVAAWTRDGEERWAWNFGFEANGVAMDEQDGVVVVGGYQGGSPDLGILGPLPGNPASNANMFVVKFDRIQGALRWSRGFTSGQDRSSPGVDSASVAVTKEGRPTVLGLFHDTLKVGASTWTAQGVSDLFLLGFEP